MFVGTVALAVVVPGFGLELKHQRGQVDVLVIESVHQPTPN
jgi:hypothetical protein